MRLLKSSLFYVLKILVKSYVKRYFFKLLCFVYLIFLIPII